MVELKRTVPVAFLETIIPNRFDSTCKSNKVGSETVFEMVGVEIGTS